MKKILVTGAAGQVGKELQELEAKYPQYQLLWTDVFELDITNPQFVADYFRKNQPDYCINCAAYTAVDKAESNEETAHKINVTGPKELAQSCLTRNIPLIQISTDYVYHADPGRPFKEDDPTNPQSVYAKTKLEGDKIALAISPMTCVIRTSWVYSSFAHNFVKTMLRLAGERDKLTIVSDQIGTPTYAADLASAMMQMIDKVEKGEVNSSKLRGIYHYSNEGVTNWAAFAKEIFDQRNLKTEVVPIPTTDYPTPAKRPPYSVLDKSKIKEIFGLEIPEWQDSLKKCLELLP